MAYLGLKNTCIHKHTRSPTFQKQTYLSNTFVGTTIISDPACVLWLKDDMNCNNQNKRRTMRDNEELVGGGLGEKEKRLFQLQTVI